MTDAMKRLAARTILTVCALWAAPAMGHAVPEQAIPAVGATLSKPPELVAIHFDAELEPLFCKLTVRNAEGAKLSTGNGNVMPGDHKVLTARISHAGKGIYHVYWDVVSRDGHRAKGDYTFTVK